MSRYYTKLFLAAIAVASVTFGPSLAAQPPALDERVAAIKQSLQESQTRIRQYEWIETTVISVKGEEKARKQQRAYFGADGKLQRLPVGGAPQQQAQQSGGRGGRLKQRIVENKKDEMQDYMERAANLMHMYVPPSPVQIQAAKDAGRIALRPPDASGRVRVEISDYLQKGDRLAIDLDAKANRLLGISVATYLEKPEDAVNLDVRLGALADGTSYTAQTALEATAQNIRVVIENTGYRPLVR